GGFCICGAEKRDETDDGARKAVTYIVAANKQLGLRPYHRYRHHVLAGAQEAHLPVGYIAAVERVESIEDTDSARVAKEGGIYQNKVAQRG
ncbi:hypothetical protein C7H84_22325, partial [Burkholderia sp. Nafp2/4-1b]